MRLVKLIPVKLKGRTQEIRTNMLNRVLEEIQLMYDNNRINDVQLMDDYAFITANVEVNEMGELISK